MFSFLRVFVFFNLIIMNRMSSKMHHHHHPGYSFIIAVVSQCENIKWMLCMFQRDSFWKMIQALKTWYHVWRSHWHEMHTKPSLTANPNACVYGETFWIFLNEEKPTQTHTHSHELNFITKIQVEVFFFLSCCTILQCSIFIHVFITIRFHKPGQKLQNGKC